MNKLLFLISVIFCSTSISAQFNTVDYDFERGWFNEGQPLPAEQSMIFKGNVPSGTEIVELNILSAKSSDLLYSAVWKKSSNNEMSLIVPFKLRASATYDFELKFYEAANGNTKGQLIDDINEMLNTYLAVNLTKSKSLKFGQKNKKLMRDMNELIADAAAEYKSSDMTWNPTLSKMVSLKLDQLENTDLAEGFDKKAENANKGKLKRASKTNLMKELKDQVEKEVQILFNRDLYKISTTRFVDNYETNSKVNSIALNAGYGGVYLNGNWDNFSYGASPYLGIAFPLGNSVLGSKFLSNSSITLGVFLENFEDNSGNEISGFIVDRPFYVGLDHKLFKFIRVNAGATFLEKNTISGGEIINKEIMIRPFLGLSARVDLSIGLGK